MKILIAADHAGYVFKQEIMKRVKDLVHPTGDVIDFVDLGTNNEERVDYPDYANQLSEHLVKDLKHLPTQDHHKIFGILICGSGVGVSIAANRHAGIRAVLAESEEVARLGREHNHANVLCLGARIITLDQGIKIINAFLGATPDQGERHLHRIQKLSAKGIIP